MCAVADVGKDDDGALTNVLLRFLCASAGTNRLISGNTQTVGWRAAIPAAGR
jgi:hypothetical protein